MLLILTPNPPHKHRARQRAKTEGRDRENSHSAYSLMQPNEEHNKIRQSVEHWKAPGVFLVHSNIKKEEDIKQNVPAALFYIMTTTVLRPI